MAVQIETTKTTKRRRSRKPKNTLNDLTGRQWIKRTKSWLVCDSRRYHRNRDTELHPARYPEELVIEFVEFFTKADQWVFDPFAGTAATLVAAHEAGRKSVGVELCANYADMSRARLSDIGAGDAHVLTGDARAVPDPDFWVEAGGSPLPINGSGLPVFDFLMTSPPYWNMLRKSRGGVESTHKERAKAGLDTIYSDDVNDLGNLCDYDQFIDALGGIFDGCYDVLKEKAYMVVVVQNVRVPEGEVRPLAWDLQKRISERFSFQGERIWCQDSKKLGIWGYPTVFVPNYHHHYCLIFQKK